MAGERAEVVILLIMSHSVDANLTIVGTSHRAHSGRQRRQYSCELTSSGENDPVGPPHELQILWAIKAKPE